jgi:hypothetical protein
MAVTKIWRVRGRAAAVIDYVNNPEKTVATATDDELKELSDVLEYVDDAIKTESHHYTTGINCDVAHAEEEFRLVKTMFGKPGGLVAIHGYQSFEEESISPQEAHEIGVQLAKELWGDRFQVLVATHLNTDHIHNHFVINTVSHIDGKKFHMCTERYLEMRAASDRLCREHRLSVIEQPQGKGKNHYAHMMDKAGMPTRYSVAREAIDEALSRSLNIEEFKGELRSMGYRYQFSPNRKYWTVTIPGWGKPIRLYQLGKDYTNERIMERLYENDLTVREEKYRQMAGYRVNAYHLPKRIDKIRRRKSGLERLYLRCCYEMGYLPKYVQRPARVHKVFKEELLKCDQYSRQARLLGEHGIKTEKELTMHMDRLEKQMAGLSSEREELRKLIKRSIPEEERIKGREKIAELTTGIRDARSELKLCKDIAERSGVLAEKLQTIEQERDRRKEVRKR